MEGLVPFQTKGRDYGTTVGGTVNVQRDRPQ